jgi:hypothetical protein
MLLQGRTYVPEAIWQNHLYLRREVGHLFSFDNVDDEVIFADMFAQYLTFVYFFTRIDKEGTSIL